MSVAKILIALGAILVVLGLAWPLVSKLPIGRLPGDIAIERENLRVYIPITTMIIVSALVSLVLWLINR